MIPKVNTGITRLFQQPRFYQGPYSTTILRPFLTYIFKLPFLLRYNSLPCGTDCCSWMANV